MSRQSTQDTVQSSATWETLEGFARRGIQELLQKVLESEVTELLERVPSPRRCEVDAQPGYRKGYDLDMGRVRVVPDPGDLEFVRRAVALATAQSLSETRAALRWRAREAV